MPPPPRRIAVSIQIGAFVGCFGNHYGTAEDFLHFLFTFLFTGRCLVTYYVEKKWADTGELLGVATVDRRVLLALPLPGTCCHDTTWLGVVMPTIH